MKNNKFSLVVLVIIAILATAGYLFYSKKSNPPVDVPNTPIDTHVNASTSDPVNDAVMYKNTEFGFSFSLPKNWLGYTIVTDKWNRTVLGANKVQSGAKLLIRNPNWTASAPYEDLPILIFTIAQWNAYRAEDFSIGAAPIPASELARNNMYVLALPARWNFDYALGYKEAEDIFRSNPITTFDVGNL